MSAAGQNGVPALELSYRRMVRWYPSRWRRANEDALVGTLLDVAASEGRDKPRRSEVVDLAVNGLGARVAAIFPASARESAATFALATGTSWALMYFFVQDWMPWNPGTPDHPGPHHYSLNPFGPFNSAGVIVTALWILATVLLFAGQVLATRIMLLTAAATSVVLMAIGIGSAPEYVQIWPNPDRLTFTLLTMLAVLAASGRPRRNWAFIGGLIAWVIGLAGGLLGAHVLDRVSVPTDAGLPYYYDYFNRYLWQGIPLSPGILALGVTVALIAATILRYSGRRGWAGATVLSAIPWAIATIINWATWGNPAAAPAVPLTIIVALWVALSIAALRPGRLDENRVTRGTPDPA